MKVVVVDKNNTVIGYKDRDTTSPEDILRVSGLWLLNGKDEVLIVQRALSKKHSPGKWGPSAAGTVEEGETYTTNIIKEVYEELGIVLTEDQLKEATTRFTQSSHTYFCLFHFASVDVPLEDFTIQQEELQEIRWISIPELEAWFAQKPEDFIQSFAASLKDLRSFKP